MTEKEQWLSKCMAEIESVTTVRHRGFDLSKIDSGKINGMQINLILNSPVTEVLKRTTAWVQINEMPERETVGSGHASRHYWPFDKVAEICMRELENLYDNDGGIPKLGAKRFVKKYRKKDKTPVQKMSIGFKREFVDEFELSSKEFGLSGRVLVEPIVRNRISLAKDSGLIP